MRRPRIFISHHAADDSALLWRVHDALSDAGFDVLMDQARLKLGSDWRNEIYTWIQQAHGAVVLLTPKALTSDWVKFELAALASRHVLGGLDLAPILAAVDPSVLRTKPFEPYDLARIQAATIDTSAADAIDRLLDLFRPLLIRISETPIDVLTTRVANELPSDIYILERAARELRAQGVVDAPMVALSFFHADVETVPAAIREVAAGRGMSRTQIERILEIVTPFWIAPQAITELAREAATPGSPHRILLVNTGDQHIGAMYVKRAALQYPMEWALVTLTAAGGDDPVGDMQGEIRKYFRDLQPYGDDAELDGYINDFSATTPVLVVLPATARLQRIAELRDIYPNCIYVRLSGTDIPDDATLRLQQSIVLEPRLASEREKTIRIEYGKCRVVVRNLS
ncbi:MAG TPA: toll/interleukin-1 receptor domain-containing protein [Thermoanaerobaculia bacterium]|jgi:hypothetical protein|nr:toll/interleukin-1 receptor domain-containing protein [Thermoanaerobaculia bacterium]